MTNNKSSYFSFKSFMKNYVNGSVLLVLATLLAVIMANSHFSEIYEKFCNFEISIAIGGFDILQHHDKTMTVRMLINDGLMALFFFAVGLEIKREFMVGELSERKHAMLPIIAAIGGVMVPVFLFKLIVTDPMIEKGAAVTMATDIAFSLGVLSTLGKRIPLSLKVFLTALAVVDDLMGIIVIALFYSGSISAEYLYISGGILALILVGAKLKVSSKAFYAVCGIAIWFMFYNSGVHATIAGVLVALCIPARPQLDTEKYINRIKDNITAFPYVGIDKNGAVILTNEQIGKLKSIESASDKVISPLQKLEDMLHPIVTYFIIPIFAFANAGINLEGVTLHTFAGETTLAIIVGLVLGKFIGIFSFSWIAIKTKIVSMPNGATMNGIAGIAILGGIGFTVSIFIGTLSFANLPDIGAEILNQAKLGIITASLISAVGGYLFLRATHKNKKY